MSANIEFKETNVEEVAFTVKISGRDKLSQLLAPVNKNYLHTEECTYTLLCLFLVKLDTSLLTKVGLDSIAGLH